MSATRRLLVVSSHVAPVERSVPVGGTATQVRVRVFLFGAVAALTSSAGRTCGLCDVCCGAGPALPVTATATTVKRAPGTLTGPRAWSDIVRWRQVAPDLKEFLDAFRGLTKELVRARVSERRRNKKCSPQPSRRSG